MLKINLYHVNLKNTKIRMHSNAFMAAKNCVAQ